MAGKLRRDVLLALASMATVSATSAFAADAAPASGKPAQAKAAEGTFIEEVVVTARRKEENLQTVPISVTVISGSALEDKGVGNLQDLQRFVPGMRVMPATTNPKIFFVSIRGFRGTNPRLTEDQPVGSYFAEIPVGHPIGFGDEIYDIQSAQVLKGPQGTLFGRNTPGGAVLIEPVKPSLDDGYGGNVKLTLGNYNQQKFNGAINIPINDVAALRISGEYKKHDGYRNSIYSSVKWDEENSTALRAQLLLRPTRDVTSNTMLTYLDEGPATPASLSAWAVYPGAAGAFATAWRNLLAQQESVGYDKVISAIGSNTGNDNLSPLRCAGKPNLPGNLLCRDGSTPKETLKSTSLTNNTKVDFDGFSIKNIIGGRRMKHDVSSYEITLGGQTAAGIQALDAQDYNQVSEEFQVLGKALDNRLDWVAGAFLFREWGEDYTPAYQFTGATWTGNKNRNLNKSRALFAQGDYKLTDRWTGTLGIRRTWDEREMHALNMVAANTVCATKDANGVALKPPCDLNGNNDSSATTWNMTLKYQMDRSMYYATLSRGYRTGGFSPLVNIPQKLAFQPEYVRNLEFGLKSDWDLAGMPVRTNVDFYYDWYSQQQLQIAQVVNGAFANFTDNVGKSHLYGSEFELTILPTDRLELSGFLSYTRAEYDDYKTRSPLGTVDLTQTEFGANYAIPKWQGGVSAAYNLPLDNDNGSVRFSADLSLRSKAPTEQNAANIVKYGSSFTPQLVEPGRGILNLRVDWDHFLGNPFKLSMYVNNAGDKVYPLGGTAVLGYQGVHLGDPRTIGFELSYKFGEGR